MVGDCWLAPRLTSVHPIGHRRDRYQALLVRAVSGCGPCLATHFWNGNEFQALSEGQARGQSSCLLALADCTVCHLPSLSVHRWKMARAVKDEKGRASRPSLLCRLETGTTACRSKRPAGNDHSYEPADCHCLARHYGRTRSVSGAIGTGSEKLADGIRARDRARLRRHQYNCRHRKIALPQERIRSVEPDDPAVVVDVAC